MILGLIKVIIILGAVGFSLYYLIYQTDLLEQFVPVRDSVDETISDIREDVPGVQEVIDATDVIIPAAQDAVTTVAEIVPELEPEYMALYAGMPYEMCIGGTCVEDVATVDFFGTPLFLSMDFSGLPVYAEDPRSLPPAYEIDEGDRIIICKPDGECLGPITIQEGPANIGQYMMRNSTDWDPEMVGPDGKFGTADDAEHTGETGICILVPNRDIPECAAWP